MLKGGVIMDVVNPEQAKIAEDAGAVAVMALERVPSDIRRDGGVSRMSDPEMIQGIQATVSIPVMAKARIGHFAEAQILQSLGVDYIDESEVLTPADEAHHIDKWAFTVPFVCGATNLGEALRRISEGACMIRSKGEAGTGNVVEAVRHLRSIMGDIRKIAQADNAELFDWAKQLQAPLPLVQEIAETGELPVPMFCAGGIATPADASLVMQLGAEAVFVGSGIFKSDEPAKMASAIVEAATHYRDPDDPREGLHRPGRRHEGPRDRHTRDEAGRAGLVAPTVGVLALQGAFAAHAAILESLGAATVEVRTAAQLADVDALVIPGGESTTMSMLLERSGMLEPLRKRVADGLPTFGTCAGMILLAAEISDGRDDQHALGAVDISVRAQRLRPPDRVVRIRPRRRRIRRPVPRRLHPGAARGAGGAGRRGAGHGRRRPGAVPPGQRPGRRLPSRAVRRRPHPPALARIDRPLTGCARWKVVCPARCSSRCGPASRTDVGGNRVRQREP